MTIDEQAKLCWSLCSAARRGWPKAEHMFRASMLHAETKCERIRKALETAFDTERLAQMIGDNGRPIPKHLRSPSATGVAS